MQPVDYRLGEMIMSRAARQEAFKQGVSRVGLVRPNWGSKRWFCGRAVLAKVPSFRFLVPSFRLFYPRSGFWYCRSLCLEPCSGFRYRQTSAKTLLSFYQRRPKGTWNDKSHEATQNLMLLLQRLLSFWLVISRLLAQTCCCLAVVVSATVTSQWWPGGEVVISRLLPLWDPRRLNWNIQKS